MRRILVPLVAAVFASPALAAEQLPSRMEEMPWHASVPACHDPQVLREIAEDFASKESNYWNSNLKIAGYHSIRDIAYRPWGADFLPRRFCVATSFVTDGLKHQVYYSVRAALGPIGLGWDVEWCVQGLDRGWSFAPNCKMALP